MCAYVVVGGSKIILVFAIEGREDVESCLQKDILMVACKLGGRRIGGKCFLVVTCWVIWAGQSGTSTDLTLPTVTSHNCLGQLSPWVGPGVAAVQWTRLACSCNPWSESFHGITACVRTFPLLIPLPPANIPSPPVCAPMRHVHVHWLHCLSFCWKTVAGCFPRLQNI